MLDWDKLRIFYTVAQTSNITKAGETLGLSQSAVSRQITALEEQLKTPLFHRRSRGLILTEQGEMLQRTVAEFFQKLSATENALMEVSERPQGKLRVTVPVALGTIWLIPLIKEFNVQYPEIHISLIVDDRELDLSMREADVALRLYPSRQPDLVQKQLITIHSSLYASNDYLRVHGMPSSLEELKQHRIIAYHDGSGEDMTGMNWLIPEAAKEGIELEPYFSVNNVYGILRALKSGMGVAALPDYMVARTKHVSQILDAIHGPPVEAYIVYPMDLKNSRRIRAFRNFVESKLTEFVF
ncbi:MAG: LysR family transcriptional regulator [Rickettsiales bacterium]|nr:LysR family transcriptional regulator [Rickettsiales bacterium]